MDQHVVEEKELNHTACSSGLVYAVKGSDHFLELRGNRVNPSGHFQ